MNKQHVIYLSFVGWELVLETGQWIFLIPESCLQSLGAGLLSTPHKRRAKSNAPSEPRPAPTPLCPRTTLESTSNLLLSRHVSGSKQNRRYFDRPLVFLKPFNQPRLLPRPQCQQVTYAFVPRNPTTSPHQPTPR